ncbi:MAG TPA: hypothetical protein PKA58_09640 [Polyangium sp.]|nr:hypothetical protein [Polyangium sp.]
MYEKVRDFIVTHWGAASAMTQHDSGPGARGNGIALVHGGVRVRPDVYGIVVSNFVEIPLLGEGKLRMGGHDGTHAVAQAIAYRNLGMLAFVFFPEAEFSTDAAPMMRAICAQAGIALIVVPPGNVPIDPNRHIAVDLAGGQPLVVAQSIEQTLEAIKGIGQRRLADVYPVSLRDSLSLFENQRISAHELEKRYLRAWDGFARVLSQRPYDPMVRRKISANTKAIKLEYLSKFTNGLIALGLIAPTSDGFRTTDLGEHIRLTSTGFAPQLDPYTRRLFAFAVMREFEQLILPSLQLLRKNELPASSRDYCKKASCGESNWRKQWINDRGALACPTCGTRSVVEGFYRQCINVGMSYSLIKFARAAGIYEARVPNRWRKDFPSIPTSKPSGATIAWNFFWLGPAVAEPHVAASSDDDDE